MNHHCHLLVFFLIISSYPLQPLKLIHVCFLPYCVSFRQLTHVEPALYLLVALLSGVLQESTVVIELSRDGLVEVLMERMADCIVAKQGAVFPLLSLLSLPSP